MKSGPVAGQPHALASISSFTELAAGPEDDEPPNIRRPPGQLPAFANHRPKKRVALVHSASYARVCDKVAADKNKYTLFTSLLDAYGLLKSQDSPTGGRLDIVQPRLCSKEQLEEFHSTDYIEYVQDLDASGEDLEDLDEEALARMQEYGLLDDGYPFEGLYKYMRVVAGSSLLAAERLKSGYDIAMNFGGGRHHAREDRAAGFCYVNDIVLSILSLLEDDRFQRILYIDLDIHHGDGVAKAFEKSPNVFCLSIHHFTPGFYPGTGSVTETGTGPGSFFNLNVPLQAGVTDQLFQQLTEMIIPRLISRFRPQAVVMCCGTDVLSNDPLGCFNVTTVGYCQVVRRVLGYCIPTLVLGGGGYHPEDCARTWTTIVSIAAQIPVAREIPEHDDYMRYKPYFSLCSRPLPMFKLRNMNPPQLVHRLLMMGRLLESRLSKSDALKQLLWPAAGPDAPRIIRADPPQAPPAAKPVETQEQAAPVPPQRPTRRPMSPLDSSAENSPRARRRPRKRRRRAAGGSPRGRPASSPTPKLQRASVYDFDPCNDDTSPLPLRAMPPRPVLPVPLVPPTPHEPDAGGHRGDENVSPETPIYAPQEETPSPEPISLSNEEIPPTPSPAITPAPVGRRALLRQNAVVWSSRPVPAAVVPAPAGSSQPSPASPAVVLTEQRPAAKPAQPVRSTPAHRFGQAVPPTPSEASESGVPLPPPTPMDGCPGSVLDQRDPLAEVLSSPSIENITRRQSGGALAGEPPRKKRRVDKPSEPVSRMSPGFAVPRRPGAAAAPAGEKSSSWGDSYCVIT